MTTWVRLRTDMKWHRTAHQITSFGWWATIETVCGVSIEERQAGATKDAYRDGLSIIAYAAAAPPHMMYPSSPPICQTCVENNRV